ncbi:MAG TPA: orotidine-5'-phosphate decarboxylase [Beijerinckiaceae bacterium]|jgi:orotidine-5'-phosphate decarboxylase
MLLSPQLDARDRLIVALDMGDADEARRLVDRVGDAAGVYKIGYRLGFAGGIALAQELIGAGRQVFLDFKLHDIGNTVEEGVQSVTALGAAYLTVHAYPQTLRAAVRGKGSSSLKILGVTVLTSYDDEDVEEAGYAGTVESLVEERTRQAHRIGADGIVCAATEAGAVRAIVGPNRLIVTPGIRPAGAPAGDQKRVVTPASAIAAGADLLVVGRPITASLDPRGVAAAIVDEIATSLR